MNSRIKNLSVAFAVALVVIGFGAMEDCVGGCLR